MEKQYRVTGQQPFRDTLPGQTFKADSSDADVQFALQIGAITEDVQKASKKEKE